MNGLLNSFYIFYHPGVIRKGNSQIPGVLFNHADIKSINDFSETGFGVMKGIDI